MTWSRYIILSLFLIVSAKAFCQDTAYEYFVTGSGNLYLPIDNPEKGVYPIVGYSKKTSPNLLIGGWGVGFSVLKPHGEKLSFKGQANLSKQTYWDQPFVITDEGRNPIQDFVAGTSDYAMGVTATAHYSLTQRLSVGTGLGGQVLLVSLSRIPTTDETKLPIAVNRYYRPLMPTLPVELTYKLQSVLFNVRYEHGLLNRLRGELKDYKQDRFGLLTFEVGLRIMQ